MRSRETSLVPTPANRALVVRSSRPRAITLRADFAVPPPPGAVPFHHRPVSKLRRWFGIIAIPCLFAMGGYIANDPEIRKAANFQVTLLTSPGISAATFTPETAEAGIPRVPRHALFLFEEGRKGPRADRFPLAIDQANNGIETASIGPAAGESGVQRAGKGDSLSLASAVAVQDGEAALPENSGLMASASFFMLPPVISDGMFSTASLDGSGDKGADTWRELIQNASLATDKAKTIFGGLTEEEFRERELRCMATAIYFEARGEPYRGQVAVGQVIMNRIRSPLYPNTICGVVFQGHLNRNACQFSFACDGKHDRPTNKSQWATAVKVAKQVLAREVWIDEIGYATHYHANYVSPDWRNLYEKVAQIGVHIFYKPPPGAVQVAFAVD